MADGNWCYVMTNGVTRKGKWRDILHMGYRRAVGYDRASTVDNARYACI